MIIDDDDDEGIEYEWWWWIVGNPQEGKGLTSGSLAMALSMARLTNHLPISLHCICPLHHHDDDGPPWWGLGLAWLKDHSFCRPAFHPSLISPSFSLSSIRSWTIKGLSQFFEVTLMASSSLWRYYSQLSTRKRERLGCCIT